MTTYEVVSDVYVELGDLPLSTPAWECLNPMELRKPALRRGQDRVIPGAAGVRPKRRRNTVTRRMLEVLVRGHVDWAGDPYTDHELGLEANLDHLVTNLLPADGEAITATLTLPDNDDIDGLIQVEQVDWVYHRHDALMTIDITIPGGQLA